jgi:uncharacterized paraquat-inducible protein A
MSKGHCPECSATISLGRTIRKNQPVECFRCGAVLVVANTSPIELDWVYETEEEADEDTEKSIDIA